MKAMTEEEKLKRKKTITLIIVYAAITLFAFIVYYLTLPPINPQSEGFWVFLAFLVLIYLAPVGFTATRGITEPRTKAQKKATFFRSGAKIADFYVKPKKILLFALIPIGIMILCGLIGTELFWAKSYASLITVSEREFKNDMQETVNVDNVALMDSESAKILGQRTLGELAWVVSQYTLSENYTQINYKNTPQKVCNLEYDGFFKWAGNRKNGIPGYVLVAPVLKKGAVSREVYLPDDEWIHIESKREYRGGRYNIPAPLGEIPVFVRKNASEDVLNILLNLY